MGLACKISGHKWNGCTCTRCGEYRDEEHKWAFAALKSIEAKQCREKCTICGKMRDVAHDWDGCTCTRCGAWRDEEHKLSEFKPADDSCLWTVNRIIAKSEDIHVASCSRCDRGFAFPHRLEKIGNCRGRCKDCGAEADYHVFEAGVCRECGIEEEQYCFDLIMSGARTFIERYFEADGSVKGTYGDRIISLEALLRLARAKKNYSDIDEIITRLWIMQNRGVKPSPSTEQELFAAACDDEDIRLREVALALIADEGLKAKARPDIERELARIEYENAMIAADSGLGRSG